MCLRIAKAAQLSVPGNMHILFAALHQTQKQLSASPTFRECHANGRVTCTCVLGHMRPPPADTLAHSPAVIRLSPEARGSKVVTSITGAPHRANGAKGAAQEMGCNFPRVGLAGGTCVYGLPKQRNSQSQATCTSCSLRFIKLKSNCRPPLLSVSAMPTAELHAHVFSAT